MIVIIRIAGDVEIPDSLRQSLLRIRLHKKYTATLLNETPENMKLLQVIRNSVAYGVIDKATLVELIAKRGKTMTSKPLSKADAERIVEQLDKKDLKSLGVKPFFRLHPPRKGIESKGMPEKAKVFLEITKRRLMI